jgi:hypothetical protein
MDKTDYYIWWHVFFGQLLTYNVQSDKGLTCKKTVGLNLNVVIVNASMVVSQEICPPLDLPAGHIFPGAYFLGVRAYLGHTSCYRGSEFQILKLLIFLCRAMFQ